MYMFFRLCEAQKNPSSRLIAGEKDLIYIEEIWSASPASAALDCPMQASCCTEPV